MRATLDAVEHDDTLEEPDEPHPTATIFIRTRTRNRNRTRACLDVCLAARFVERQAIEVELDRIDHVIAALYKLCHKPRP